MASRRPLIAFDATVAVVALTVGAVLVGTAPVSAAPSRSSECTTASEALAEEFGGPVDAALEAELRRLVAQHDEDVSSLLGTLNPLYLPQDEAEWQLQQALLVVGEETDRLTSAQRLVDLAVDDLAQAEVDLQAAVDGGDQAAVDAATIARDQAAARLAEAEGFRDEADGSLDSARAALAEAEAALAVADADIAVVQQRIDALNDEIEAVFLDRFGSSDYDRLLEVLAVIDVACDAENQGPGPAPGAGAGDGSGASDGVDPGTGGEADAGSTSGTAPVAEAVTGRASYTG